MEHLRSLGHSAFVLGYSGVAGSALVKELNKANIFKKVVLIGRRVLPLDVGPEFVRNCGKNITENIKFFSSIKLEFIIILYCIWQVLT